MHQKTLDKIKELLGEYDEDKLNTGYMHYGTDEWHSGVIYGRQELLKRLIDILAEDD